MEHKQITARGGTVHYFFQKSAQGKGCIFFTHGLTADHRMFEKQTEHFGEEYDLLLWDVPMHGLSRPYDGFSYAETARIMHDILLRENIGSVVLVGMSMGGYPCQHFAARYPETVRGFIAIDTTPLGKSYYSRSDIWWLKRAASMAKLFPTGLLKKSMARSISATRYSYEKMLEMLAPLSKEDIVAQMHVAYDRFIDENMDVSFDFPVMIILGEKDSSGKVRQYCEKWAEQTGYPLYRIKGAKHFANGDRPDEVNALMESFLDEVCGGEDEK